MSNSNTNNLNNFEVQCDKTLGWYPVSLIGYDNTTSKFHVKYCHNWKSSSFVSGNLLRRGGSPRQAEAEWFPHLNEICECKCIYNDNESIDSFGWWECTFKYFIKNSDGTIDAFVSFTLSSSEQDEQENSTLLTTTTTTTTAAAPAPAADYGELSETCSIACTVDSGYTINTEDQKEESKKEDIRAVLSRVGMEYLRPKNCNQSIISEYKINVHRRNDKIVCFKIPVTSKDYVNEFIQDNSKEYVNKLKNSLIAVYYDCEKVEKMIVNGTQENKIGWAKPSKYIEKQVEKQKKYNENSEIQDYLVLIGKKQSVQLLSKIARKHFEWRYDLQKSNQRQFELEQQLQKEHQITGLGVGYIGRQKLH